MLNKLIISLSYTGVGGKVSSGYGKFKPEIITPSEDVIKKLENKESYKQYMSLSICLPKEEELEKSLDKASYIIVKRSGFIASSSYANTFRKKKDIYMLEAGSVYINEFTGDIYDVSERDKNIGTHPVYRYGIPFFMGVK